MGLSLVTICISFVNTGHTMNKRVLLRILISLLFSINIISCNGKNDKDVTAKVKEKSSITIGYGAPELSGGQVAIMNGLISRAKAKGWKIVTANANSDSKIQSSQIDYFISLGVQAIIVVPIDSRGICDAIQKSKAGGILFFTIDRAPIGCEYNMAVLADNFLAGTQAGQALVELLIQRYGKPKGTILELQGDLRQNVSQLRGGGFHAIVDHYPGIEVISKPTGWQSAQFAAATMEVVSNINIDGVYLHSDCIGIPVILPVLEKLNKKISRGEKDHIFIVGVDGCSNALQAIRDGYADQASSQPLPDFGIITEWIEKKLNGEKIEAAEVTEEGALWSPATLKKTDAGWQLFLSTTSVTIENVDNPALWGNQ